MLIAMALGVVAAWLAARRFRRWWFPAAFFSGAAIAVVVAIASGLLGLMLPGQAVGRAIATAPINGIFCALCAWAFARKR